MSISSPLAPHPQPKSPLPLRALPSTPTVKSSPSVPLASQSQAVHSDCRHLLIYIVTSLLLPPVPPSASASPFLTATGRPSNRPSQPHDHPCRSSLDQAPSRPIQANNSPCPATSLPAYGSPPVHAHIPPQAHRLSTSHSVRISLSVIHLSA